MVKLVIGVVLPRNKLKLGVNWRGNIIDIGMAVPRAKIEKGVTIPRIKFIVL